MTMRAPTLQEKLTVGVLCIVLSLFATALFVEFVEYEVIAKLLVMPMLTIGIIVTGYGILKSL